MAMAIVIYYNYIILYYSNNIASTTDGIDSNTTVLRIVKLYYTAPNLVSYQKVLNKSLNFSSRPKFSRKVFACRQIKKIKFRNHPVLYIYYNALRSS